MGIREEMMSGRLYDASDSSLLDGLYRTQEMCQRYNAIPISHLEERDALIRKIIGKARESYHQSLFLL